MDSRKSLMVSIVNFLKSEIESEHLDEDSKEGLEVATQCLEAAYNLDSIENKEGYPHLIKLFESRNEQNTHSKTETPTQTEKYQAENLKTEGNDLMKINEVHKAVDCYSKAIQLDPSNAVYYSNRAAAYTKLSENIKAIADCQKAISIDPNYGKAYGRMGLVYLNDKNYEKAVKTYEKAVALEPDNALYKTHLQSARESFNASKASNASRPQSAGGGDASGGTGANNFFGNMNISSIMSNPAFMNMAQSVMQNPQMQNIFASMMGGGGSDGAAASQTPTGASEPGADDDVNEGANSQTTGAMPGGLSGLGGLLPPGLNFENVMSAAQQFAQQNPEMVDNLRAQYQQGSHPSSENQDGAGQPPSNNEHQHRDGYS